MTKRMYTILHICMCILLLFSGCTTSKSTTSLDDYLNTTAPLTYSEQILFPNKESLTNDVVNFYKSETVKSLLFDDVYFLLSCTYSDSYFTKELDRIQKSKAEYREDIFQYPAYVMLCYGNYFEYVLLDFQTNCIVYIAAETADFGVFKDFPDNYKPYTFTNIDICHYNS